MAERISEHPAPELTSEQLARKGADMFIVASAAVPSSPACQGAYIALECQKQGLSVLHVAMRLGLDDDAQDRAVRAANAVHSHHPHIEETLLKVHKSREVTRELAMTFIDAAYTFAATLVYAPAPELQKIIDMHPGNGQTSYDKEGQIQREARRVSRDARRLRN